MLVWVCTVIRFFRAGLEIFVIYWLFGLFFFNKKYLLKYLFAVKWPALTFVCEIKLPDNKCVTFFFFCYFDIPLGNKKLFFATLQFYGLCEKIRFKKYRFIQMENRKKKCLNENVSHTVHVRLTCDADGVWNARKHLCNLRLFHWISLEYTICVWPFETKASQV